MGLAVRRVSAADLTPLELQIGTPESENGIAFATLLTEGKEQEMTTAQELTTKAQSWVTALKERGLTIPEIILIAGTRVALGVGVGLLIADRLTKDERKGAGWALLGVGVLTTIPIARGVLGKRLLE